MDPLGVQDPVIVLDRELGAMGDEEAVLRQRLLAKENNLRNLTKHYLGFVSSIESSSNEEADAIYQGLLKELTAYEFTVLKASALVDTNLRQIEDYDAMQQNIDAEMCAPAHPDALDLLCLFRPS